MDWINAKEKLPELYKDVLVCAKDDSGFDDEAVVYDVAHRQDNGEWKTQHSFYYNEEVFYWMDFQRLKIKKGECNDD